MSERQRPLVMGVVNVTPDSFSDGGRYIDHEAAVAHGLRLVADGADILDIGGESTRPHAEPVEVAEELSRVIPVIAAIRKQSDVPISIDTMKPEVARAAVAAGASLWNDVTALTFDEDSPAVAAELGCQVILMHMRGEPRTMQDDPHYEDVIAEVCAHLLGRAAAVMIKGVAPDRIWLDPGLGFGKTAAHTLTLLGHLDEIGALGFPVLVGASRKSFLRAVDKTARNASDRLGGSIAVALAAAKAGAACIRVHDVRETVQALDLQAAIDEAGRG